MDATPPGLQPAIFLDRDGTLIEEREYLREPGEVAFFSGAAEALVRARQAGYLLILVTNQSGVGRGYFSMADVEIVHGHILRVLAGAGVEITKIYTAPEVPGQPSRGRKPSPAFFFDARDEFGVDLARSYMIGDKWIDLQAGWNAGMRQSILVRTGYGARTEAERGGIIEPAVAVDNLAAAVAYILKGAASSK